MQYFPFVGETLCLFIVLSLFINDVIEVKHELPNLNSNVIIVFGSLNHLLRQFDIYLSRAP